MKSFLKFLRAFFLLFIPRRSYSIPKSLGKGYCTIRHPIEFLTGNRNTTCESQHIIQRDKGGNHALNTIWINTHLHDYLDRSTCRPWKKNRPLLKLFGNKNLERAYMMGAWANGFHFFIYDHHGNGQMSLFRWDAATHLLHIWIAIINYPQKELNYLLYQISLLMVGRKTQIIDALLGILIDFLELIIGLAYALLGVFIGMIFHPFDTIRNFFPSIILMITGSIQGIYQLLVAIVTILTFGKIGRCFPS